MNDDELRRELERRSRAASFRAEELLPEVRRWTDGGFKRPARFARWAPLAGLVVAVIIVLAVVIAWPRNSPNVGVPPSASDSPAPTPQFSCGSTVSITDPAGLVESCNAGINYSVIGKDNVTVSSERVLEAQWTAATCTPIQLVTIDHNASGDELTITEGGPEPPLTPNASCAGGPMGIVLTITLHSPVSSPLGARLNGEELHVVYSARANSSSPGSTTQPSPDLSPTGSTGASGATPAPPTSIKCEDWNGNMPAVRLVDHTGQATGCTAALDTPYKSPPPGFASPAGDSFQATFSFGCANDPMTTNMGLWQRPNPGQQPKYVLVADRRYTTGGCLIDIGSRQVVVELAQPVQQSDVQVVDMEEGLSSYYQADAATGLDFNLQFKADQDAYAMKDQIDASATLQVIDHESGSPTDATLGGSGAGLMAFGVEQLGTDLKMGPVWPADCRDYSVTAATQPTQSLSKSGGFSGDNHNAEFWRGWFDDSEFHLPPGQWLLTTFANFYDGSCSSEANSSKIELNASVVVDVTAR